MPDQDLTIQQIQKAGETIARRRPAYEPLIRYFMDVFTAQERSRAAIDLPPPAVDAAQVAAKLERGFPAMTLADFTWDAASARELLGKLCDIVSAHQPDWSESARRLADALTNGRLDPGPTIRALLEENDRSIADAADGLDIDPQMLATLLYNSIQPSIRHTAAQVSTLLGEADQKQFSFCPVCGTPPALSVIDDAGKRELACGFCWTQWPARRVACPQCGNTDGESFHYFYDPDEMEYRVEVCRQCTSYIKTIDRRELDRPLYLPLEQVATMHLDMKAEEELEESGEAGKTNTQ